MEGVERGGRREEKERDKTPTPPLSEEGALFFLFSSFPKNFSSFRTKGTFNKTPISFVSSNTIRNRKIVAGWGPYPRTYLVSFSFPFPSFFLPRAKN